MCGITGLLRQDGGEVDPRLLQRMIDAIAHRGPDGQGSHLEPGLGLGHLRLSIVDVAGGAQPMTNEDGSVLIVFNGEIYNFPALRPELQARGHRFANRCDTEAVVHAWEEWGPDCVDHLDGMFAFALWDRRQQTLFLARDRLGKKPLHYARTPWGLAFASELAALRDIPGLKRRLDPAAVDDFFALGYVPDPATIFADIHKLPPGHTLTVRPRELASGLPAPRRYWSLDHTPDRGPGRAATPAGIEAAAAELRCRLEAATQARLMADVPLGAFLSGGVDSSGVVAAASRARAARGEAALDTFTIGFPGAADETPYAAMVATHCGTVQHDQTARGIDWIAAAHRQGGVFGEPFGDSSAVPTLAVCRLARAHATVALSGDGGDEVFAGYRRHRWHLLVETARRTLPPGLRGRVIGGLARAYPKLDRAPRFLRAKHTLTELSLSSAAGYYRTMARTQDARRRSLFAPSLRAALDGHDPGARFQSLMQSGPDDPLAQAQHADLATWLPGMMLTKVDRTSMAASLEVRCPLLDHRLVEWGLALPAAMKLRPFSGEGKLVLKRALEPWLPHAVLYRPKQGFATPLGAILRQEMGRVRGQLDGLGACGLFDPEGVGRLADEHASGRSDHAQPLWLLLVFAGFLASETGDRVTPASRPEFAAETV